MSLRARILALLAAASIAAAHPALAGWSNNPGVNLPVAPNGNNQDAPLVIEDGEGGAFCVWNEGATIRAQRLGASGYRVPGWPADGIVLAMLPSSRYVTGVTPDGFGGFIAVWEDYRNVGANTDVYVQRIDGAGNALWPANGLQVINTAGHQYYSRVCADGTGGAIVTWVDERNLGTSGQDVYAQRIHSTGYAMWPGGGIAVCEQPLAQDRAMIAADGTPGGCYILWRDARAGSPNFGIYASRLDGDGNLRPGWSYGGNALCAAPNYKDNPVLMADGSFGMIAAWSDFRTGLQTDIFAVRYSSAGVLAPGWATNGTNVTNDVYNQDSPAIVTDGADGAILAYTDTRPLGVDIYAQHISAGGSLAWGAGGVAATQAPGSQYLPVMAADGLGGAVLGWVDARMPNPPGLYAQKLTAGGAIEPGWPANGVLVSNQWTQTPAVCADGAGGGIFAWQVNAFTQFVAAQRVDRWGYLGVQPRITSVGDVPNDQGGRVKLAWNRSPIDAYPANGIALYRVFRSVPPNAPGLAVAKGGAVALAAYDPGAGEHDAWSGRVFSTSVAGSTFYWEYVTSVTAYQLPGYSVVTATLADSVAGSNPSTAFMIRAEDLAAGRYWLSDPDSGYSVDDLAPAAPAPFTGVYQAGATYLHWAPNAEPDIAGYRLHRGTSAAFVPDAGNLVSDQPDTGYVDAGPAGRWYKLVAEDTHGNRSPVALLAPTGTTDVPGEGGLPTLALTRLYPNPASSSTECRFALPASGHARLEVFDPAGRRVRQLLDADLPAGEHATTWDGRDDSGARIRGGLYFIRLEFGGTRLARRLVLLGG